MWAPGYRLAREEVQYEELLKQAVSMSDKRDVSYRVALEYLIKQGC